MLISRKALPRFLKILESGKIAIVIGARQVGKTTLVAEALKARNAVMLNFDIPFDVARFKAASVLPPIDGLKTLGNPEVLIIDEAQREPECARIVKGWYDSQLPVKFVLLGSSSLNLLSRATESLTGRNLKIQLPPFVLSESLSAVRWIQ